MKSKLLDSFLWRDNNGVCPECENVEVIFRDGTKHKYSRSNSEFFFVLATRWKLLGEVDDIIKYREISKEEYNNYD